MSYIAILRMLRIRGIAYILGAMVIVLLLTSFNSASFSLQMLLHPAPRAPPVLKFFSPLINRINKKGVKADDPNVIKVLREEFLTAPSNEPYNLTTAEEVNPSMGQAQRIDYILREKRDGFYIECGALDGETRSNTLFFERHRGWKGILIEADPSNYDQMLFKHRKSYMSESCLAPTTYPTTVMFEQAVNMGHIVGALSNTPGGEGHGGSVLEVQCFPLYSYMVALNVTTVDYFSLDIEGAEYSILKTIPWDKVNIKTLSVEYIHDPEGKEVIRNYMISKGYILHSEVTHPKWLANDFIFVKKDVLYGPGGVFKNKMF